MCKVSVLTWFGQAPFGLLRPFQGIWMEKMSKSGRKWSSPGQPTRQCGSSARRVLDLHGSLRSSFLDIWILRGDDPNFDVEFGSQPLAHMVPAVPLFFSTGTIPPEQQDVCLPLLLDQETNSSCVAWYIPIRSVKWEESQREKIYTEPQQETGNDTLLWWRYFTSVKVGNLTECKTFTSKKNYNEFAAILMQYQSAQDLLE